MTVSSSGVTSSEGRTLSSSSSISSSSSSSATVLLRISSSVASSSASDLESSLESAASTSTTESDTFCATDSSPADWDCEVPSPAASSAGSVSTAFPSTVFCASISSPAGSPVLSVSPSASSWAAGSCLRGRLATTSICRSSKAGLDCTHSWLGSGGSISECSPQPWSKETTRPSSGLHLLAHTPNIRSSSPASGTKKPQVEHRLPSAVLVLNALGPRGPSYQRLAACARPSEVST